MADKIKEHKAENPVLTNKPKPTGKAERTAIVQKPSRLQKTMFFMGLLGLIGTSIVVYNQSNGFTQNPYKKIRTEKKDPHLGVHNQTDDPKEIAIKDKTEKPAKVLPNSMTPQMVLKATNAHDRYESWLVPSNKWFGRVHNIRAKGEGWRVLVSTIPYDVDIFSDLKNLPPDINESDYVEIFGKIKAIRTSSNAPHIKYIDLEKATIIKRSRRYVYIKFTPDYDTVICVQKKLKEYNYYYSTIDGVSGYFTEQAVKNFLNKSSILDELGLSLNSSNSKLCETLQNISKEEYDTKVKDHAIKEREKRDSDFFERLNQQTRTYNETKKSDLDYLIETDNVTWKKAKSDGGLKKIYEYLTAEHFSYNRDYRNNKLEFENSTSGRKR